MIRVRSFTVDIAQDDLDDLRARLAITRWIDDVFNGDGRYGASLPFVRGLVEYWRDHFDWRALEARINRESQVLVDLDGLTIHAVHRRSPRSDARPILLLHGWPSSFLEFLGICEALAEPVAGEPAFHVVLASLPGYAFSTTRMGMTPMRIAILLAEMMGALGYPRYFVQGGNWGSTIAVEMARRHPDQLFGLHLNSITGPAPAGPHVMERVTPAERSWLEARQPPGMHPHFVLYSQAPASLSHALNDSPAGLAAWLGLYLRDWADGDLPGNPALTFEWMVSTIALYWLTRTATTASLLYYEMARTRANDRYVSVPTGVFLPAKEIVQIPGAWAKHLFNVVRWTRPDHGGHYPAIEIPASLVGDLRAFASICD